MKCCNVSVFEIERVAGWDIFRAKNIFGETYVNM